MAYPTAPPPPPPAPRRRRGPRLALLIPGLACLALALGSLFVMMSGLQAPSTNLTDGPGMAVISGFTSAVIFGVPAIGLLIGSVINRD